MSGTPGLLLALDTATSQAVVALGDRDGRLVAERAWAAGHRHGEELLVQVRDLLGAQRTTLDEVAAVIVGTGPGAFTGLRVGLATAKGLAHGLGRPILGVATAAALLAAASRADGNPARALLLPAGPTDRVLVVDGEARLLPAGAEPEAALEAGLVAVDLDGRAPATALARGAAARLGLGQALLALGATRLARHEVDDLARLVPEYVTLPRGVLEQRGEIAWSRGPR